MADKNLISAPARRGRPPKSAAPVSAVKVPSRPIAKAAPKAAPASRPTTKMASAPVSGRPIPDAAPAALEQTHEMPPIITSADQSTAALQAAKQEGMTMVDVIESTKKYADDAKVRFQSAFSDIGEKAKATMEKSTKIMEEISDLTKGNVEALVESGKIAAKGVEAMGQEAAEYGRISFEKASATMKNFASIKTPAEFFQLQSELLSTSFDAFAKETAKNSEAMLKLVGEVVQPISSRVSIVTDKVKSLAA